MIFSVNQTRQLYVATELKEGTAHVLESDNAGAISVKTDAEDSNLYFEYKSADNLVRSDLVKISDIMSVKATDAKTMGFTLKKVAVTLDTKVNGGNPIVGQDYMLRIMFRQLYGISDYEQYYKYGMVHVYSGMTASEFYKTLAISLAKNFSREPQELLEFHVAGVKVDQYTKLEDIKSDATELIISEVEQPWTLGIGESKPVYFELSFDEVTFNTDEMKWGIVTEKTDGKFVGNGKKIADLEYFCMGERGDIYRKVDWPNYVDTKYLVDPSKEYHTLDIHYCFVGSNESSQKSEKDITIVSDDKSVINGIVSQINSITGKSIAVIPSAKPDDTPSGGDGDEGDGDDDDDNI